MKIASAFCIMISMDYVIQKAELKDASVVTNIIHKSLHEDFPFKKEAISGYCNNYDEKYFTDIIKSKKNVILGCYKNEQLVGVIVLKIEFGGVVFVEWLVVKKEYRKKGIGTSLLEKADEWALSNKCHYFYLFTETDKNIKFYEQRGYKFVGTQNNSWFGERAYLLEKQLRSEPFPEAFILK